MLRISIISLAGLILLGVALLAGYAMLFDPPASVRQVVIELPASPEK